MREPVNIFMTSYYFTDVVFKTIDKLNEYTKYPIRIIVGDNHSVNSEEIKKGLIEYVNDGKIYAAYLYDGNNKTNVSDHMFLNEDESEYSIVTDSDSMIVDDPGECWLTSFIDMLESDKNIGIVGFSSKNNSLHRSIKGNKQDDISSDKFYISKPSEIMTRIPFQGHYMTLRSNLLRDYYTDKSEFTSDGNLQRYLASKGYNSARYDNSSVYNMSSIKCGYNVDDFKSNVDLNYKKERIDCKFGIYEISTYTKIKK